MGDAKSEITTKRKSRVERIGGGGVKKTDQMFTSPWIHSPVTTETKNRNLPNLPQLQEEKWGFKSRAVKKTDEEEEEEDQTCNNNKMALTNWVPTPPPGLDWMRAMNNESVLVVFFFFVEEAVGCFLSQIYGGQVAQLPANQAVSARYRAADRGTPELGS